MLLVFRSRKDKELAKTSCATGGNPISLAHPRALDELYNSSTVDTGCALRSVSAIAGTDLDVGDSVAGRRGTPSGGLQGGKGASQRMALG